MAASGAAIRSKAAKAIERFTCTPEEAQQSTKEMSPLQWKDRTMRARISKAIEALRLVANGIKGRPGMGQHLPYEGGIPFHLQEEGISLHQFSSVASEADSYFKPLLFYRAMAAMATYINQVYDVEYADDEYRVGPMRHAEYPWDTDDEYLSGELITWFCSYAMPTALIISRKGLTPPTMKMYFYDKEYILSSDPDTDPNEVVYLLCDDYPGKPRLSKLNNFGGNLAIVCGLMMKVHGVTIRAVIDYDHMIPLVTFCGGVIGNAMIPKEIPAHSFLFADSQAMHNFHAGMLCALLSYNNATPTDSTEGFQALAAPEKLRARITMMIEQMESRQKHVIDTLASPGWETRGDMDPQVQWTAHAHKLQYMIRMLRENDKNSKSLHENVVHFCQWLCDECLSEFASEELEKEYFGYSYRVVA